MINELLPILTTNQNLTFDQSQTAINEIMSGEVSPVIISAFLTSLATKGATDEEIAGAACGMRDKSLKLNTEYDTLDIVGTGGDKSNSFNISTTAAIVAATAGCKIAKHGNRAASSKCGTADCLESLGVKIDAPTSVMKKSLDENNICFLFAQKYHTAMKYVGPIRKEIAIPTVFNVLGPLTNPASAKKMVLGVFKEEYVMKMANALIKLGVTDALVVYGNDGLDEISACDTTTVAEVRNEKITQYKINPQDFGFECAKKQDLQGGTPQENAQITLNILQGKGTTPQNVAVIMNAGAGIYVNNKDLTLKKSIQMAQDILSSGKGYNTLQNFIATTNGE